MSSQGKPLLEILSFATCLMQLKNLTCNYFGVACNMCSCMRHILVAKDKISTSELITIEESFLDISKHVLKTSYSLNLGHF